MISSFIQNAGGLNNFRTYRKKSTGGGHINHGPRKEVLARPTQGSGLESRWKEEVYRAAAGVERDDLNRIVTYVLGKYESDLRNGILTKGHSFDEIYDYDTAQPKPHYREIYGKVKDELRGAGLERLR